jgi:hypothetical protein
MHTAFILSVFALTALAAARSTWSPCGLSMLSSITPLGEVGRGHRFRSTAGWFVAGGVAGGATFGAIMAAAAAGVAALGPSAIVSALGAAAVCAVAVAVDLGLFGPRIPTVRRQVNEIWLDRYRGWVYGAAFGWQIGVGFTTFVMTAAVLALVPLAALTGSPLVAFAVGSTFGGLRGLTVLLGRSVQDPASLQAAHRRLVRLREPVRLAVAAALAAVAALLSIWAWRPSVLVVAAVAIGATATAVVHRGSARLKSSSSTTGELAAERSWLSMDRATTARQP